MKALTEISQKITRLFIIGAGASFPYGLPTLKTLLWHLYQFVDEKEQSILEQAIFEACGVSIENLQSQTPDFEEFLNRLNTRSLTYLYERGQNTISNLRTKAGFVVLEGLRNFILDKCRTASIQGGPYDLLIKSLKTSDAIVSFNWDVLLEAAFRLNARKYDYTIEQLRDDSVLLIRPHGCISWFALLDRELLSIDMSANVGVLGNNLEYYMLYLKDPLGPKDMGISSYHARQAISPLSAIIPPNSSMMLSVGGPTHDGFVDSGHERAMRSIWSAFKTLVKSVKEIVIIGYSLPGTDMASIEVMKEFSKNSDNIDSKSLRLIDRNKELVDRYRNIVFQNAKLICDDFINFDPKIL